MFGSRVVCNSGTVVVYWSRLNVGPRVIQRTLIVNVAVAVAFAPSVASSTNTSVLVMLQSSLQVSLISPV